MKFSKTIRTIAVAVLICQTAAFAGPATVPSEEKQPSGFTPAELEARNAQAAGNLPILDWNDPSKNKDYNVAVGRWRVQQNGNILTVSEASSIVNGPTIVYSFNVNTNELVKMVVGTTVVRTVSSKKESPGPWLDGVGEMVAIVQKATTAAARLPNETKYLKNAAKVLDNAAKLSYKIVTPVPGGSIVTEVYENGLLMRVSQFAANGTRTLAYTINLKTKRISTFQSPNWNHTVPATQANIAGLRILLEKAIASETDAAKKATLQVRLRVLEGI